MLATTSVFIGSAGSGESLALPVLFFFSCVLSLICVSCLLGTLLFVLYRFPIFSSFFSPVTMFPFFRLHPFIHYLHRKYVSDWRNFQSACEESLNLLLSMVKFLKAPDQCPGDDYTQCRLITMKIASVLW